MQRLAWVALLAAACSNNVHNQRADSPSPRADDAAAHIENGLLPAVRVRGEERRWTLAARMREHRVPAVSIAVINHYRIEWAKAYGLADVSTGAPATTDTLFQAGSISKPVATLAALMAVEQGKLSLDAPINDALTSWKLPDNDLTRAAPVTLRRLLSHTAGTTVHGFPGYPTGTPVPTLRQVLDGAPPANTPAIVVDLAPGSKFRYSGGGFTIMQQALIDRLGQPFPTILHDSVLAPLGMSASTYQQPLPPERIAAAAAGHDSDGSVIEGKRNVYPEMAAAGLWTTPSDLARFLIELQLARAGRGKRVSQTIANEMTTRFAEAGPGDDIALGLFLSHAGKTFGHGGADEGFQAAATASLDRGYGVVMMANSNNGFAIFEEIERAVAVEYGWDKQPELIVRAAIAPAQLARLAGRFATNGVQPFTITTAGTRVELRRPFADADELVPIDADTLVSVDLGARLKVDAQARELTVTLPHGEVRKATRLAEDARIPILELEAGHYDAALAGYLELQKATPDSPALDEERLNFIGIDQVFRGRFDKGIALLRVNVALHPDAMNCYDSLADAYARAGDTAKAITTYEAGLAAMARDRTSPPPFKAMLQRRAVQQMKLLRAR